MTLSSRHEDKNGNLFGMDAQGDALDDMRVEASGILQIQYERGNNGFVKRKYVTLTIEAENLPAARARFSRIEADTLNRFKVMGAGARVLDGKERLALLHGLLHPEGGQFAFEWNWLPASGLSVKDFIAPSSFEFGETRRFRIGEMYGAVSFLQILAPEIQDRNLTDFMDVEGNLLVTMHVRGINQNEAIKMVKRKITDLDAMKIQEQKKAARSGYDLDILPSDLSTYGGAAKNLLQDLQSRNERMFNMTFLMLHLAPTKQKLEIAVSQSASVAQTHNCILTRLDFQQEDGLVSSLPLGLNRIRIERSLTTSALAVFVPFVTQELFMGGDAMYYGLNALSGNMILFRKWGGVPTGATQNPKDLLHSPEIENILENSDFIYLLNLSAGDRKLMTERLNISAEQLAYVTNADPGSGLLFFQNVILPFKDEFPKTTELYRLLTTKPSEVSHGGESG